MSSRGRTVCVIGAGVAGLVTAKVLKEDGFDVTVFEKNAGIGGIWEITNTYPNLHTQSPEHQYAFSDFEHFGNEETAESVRDYLQAYSDKFQVTPLIRFNIQVLDCRPLQGGSRWEVAVKNLTNGAENTHIFDLLCICAGAFGEPNIPKIADQEKFTGEIVHTRHFRSEDSVKDKRVAIIGMGKSALDCSAFSGSVAKQTYLIFQKAYWAAPRLIANGKLDRKYMLNRLAESMLPPHYSVSPWPQRLLHWLAPKFIKKYWTNVRFGMQQAYNLPPDHPLIPVDDRTKPLSWIAGLTPKNFMECVRAEKIKCIKATIKRFTGPKTVELSTGEQLELDTVILATGYYLNFSFFDEQLKKKMGIPYRLGAETGTDIELYRQVFPLEVPNIAFNGYRVTLTTPKSFEVTAHYISDYFQNKLVNLPKTLKEKKEENEREAKFLRRMGDKGLMYWAPYNQITCDILVQEMGLPIRRQTWFFPEYFIPLTAYAYKNLGQQRRDRDAGKTVSQLYIGFFPLLFTIWALFAVLIYFLFF